MTSKSSRKIQMKHALKYICQGFFYCSIISTIMKMSKQDESNWQFYGMLGKKMESTLYPYRFYKTSEKI